MPALIGKEKKAQLRRATDQKVSQSSSDAVELGGGALRLAAATGAATAAWTAAGAALRVTDAGSASTAGVGRFVEAASGEGAAVVRGS